MNKDSIYFPPYCESEWAEILRAVGELSIAMGNPAVDAEGEQTIESQTIRLAAARIVESSDCKWPNCINGRRHD